VLGWASVVGLKSLLSYVKRLNDIERCRCLNDGLTNACIEAANNKIQVTVRTGYDYRNVLII
jgi:transposase